MKAFAILTASLGLSVAACGQTAGPHAGSHTHWLETCRVDTNCGDDLACRCGRCVAPCTTPDAPCSAPVADTSCFAADSAAVTELCDGVTAPEPLCLAPCTSEGECGAEACVAGACVPVQSTGGTSGTGGAPSSGGTAAGGSGGRVVCGVQICDAGEICCGPAECGYCINALSGANCPDVCVGTGGAGGAAGVCSTNYAIPDLDRTCTTSADCFLGAHWADCCGSQTAVAFNNTELATFTAAETDCGPSCACPESGPLAEDGALLTTLTDAVAECIDGQCIARGPQFAGTCLTSDVCIDTTTGGECIAAPGPLGAGICRGASGLCFLCECAAPDTPIATPSGERPIAELGVGDLVYSVEGEAIVAVPIARVNRRHVEGHHVVELRLERGTVLHVSAGHPTADGRTFGDLVAGDELDGQRVLDARLVAYPHPYTYDILPASPTGTYFAGGALIGSTLR